MMRRQIEITLNRIEKSKKEGYHLEALLKNYHLNIEILKLISEKLNPKSPTQNIKVKTILNALITDAGSMEAKSLISKKNLKALKPWLNNMDVYFKTLKQSKPQNTKSMLIETEKIFCILNISLAKILPAK